MGKLVEEVPVYARVSPEHKLTIVEAMQEKGHIVAMTGDGVNDAPALRKADIGVAMGVTGTDVSKEAADMVLTDDNFATIVAAVEQGRVIYDNIRKFIKYLLTSNSAEILVMLVGPFLGLGLPLLPLQILWINLVTDGPPALALSAEPAERGIMRRPPHPPGEGVFARGLGRHVVWVGALMALVSLATGLWYSRTAPEIWQTMVFTTLTLSQLSHVMAIRSGERVALQGGPTLEQAAPWGGRPDVRLATAWLSTPPSSRDSLRQRRCRSRISPSPSRLARSSSGPSRSRSGWLGGRVLPRG